MKKRLSHPFKVAGVAFLAAIALSVAPAVAHADRVDTNSSPGALVHSASLPDGEKRYIVQYGKYANAEAESESLEQRGIEVKDTLSHAMKASIVVASLTEIESLRNSDNVASVELDSRVSVYGSTSIWGLDRVDQRSGTDGQYALGDEGAGVNIYVVDTGLNLSHTEFSGRVPAGWSGINDGRGVQDCNGHGTHVAGTAAGTTYGVAKKANIIPIRVLECDGSGWSSSVMAGIDWAISHHLPGQPAVLNLSLGGFTNDSFDRTVQSAVDDGMTVVAAAGNSGVDACAASPARVSSAITVAATNVSDAQVSWSNYGSCVDVQAPGLAVRSAWINSSTGNNLLDGTSMATPHVSGAAAILLSRDPGLPPSQVSQTIINHATMGVVSANKGATPNRLLYIPAPTPALPSCSDLKLGNAWAGVGMHCGLQGSTPSTAAAPEAVVTAIEAPAVAAVEAPAPSATPTAEPAPTPSPAPAPAQLAPARADAPAASQQLPAASTRHVPVVGHETQEVAVAEPALMAPGPVRDGVAIEPEARSLEELSSTAAVASASVPAPSSGDPIALVGSAMEETVEPRVVAGANTSVWAATIGLVLAGLVIAYVVRRRQPSRAWGSL